MNQLFFHFLRWPKDGAKKLVYILLCIISNFAYSAEQKSKHSKFAPYSTEHFLYTKTSTIMPVDEESVSSRIISDITTKSYFTTGITRTLISQEIENDAMVITTQTWTTKNPSYLTWTNGIAACLLICIPTIILQLRHEDCIMYGADKFLNYLLSDKKYKTKMITLLADKAINQRLISEQDIVTAIGQLGLQQFKKAIQAL